MTHTTFKNDLNQNLYLSGPRPIS